MYPTTFKEIKVNNMVMFIVKQDLIDSKIMPVIFLHSKLSSTVSKGNN